MIRTVTGWRTAMMLVLAGGCAVELEEAERADDEVVLDHVEALGFDRDAAQVVGERVVVEGDMIFDRDALLQGEYERSDALNGGEMIAKGYRYPALIAEKHRGNIRLAFASGRYAPTKEIRSAFIAAAKSWSSVPGSSIRISTENTGPAIVVRTVPTDRWDKYADCKDTDACTYAPLNGRPGFDLFIRAKSIEPGCADWSPSLLAYAARHELGHALGFAHPKEKGSKHVKGTQACSKTTANDCSFEINYSTVMAAADTKGGCVYSPARVTQDDYATCKTVYPAK